MAGPALLTDSQIDCAVNQENSRMLCNFGLWSSLLLHWLPLFSARPRNGCGKYNIGSEH